MVCGGGSLGRISDAKPYNKTSAIRVPSQLTNALSKG